MVHSASYMLGSDNMRMFKAVSIVLSFGALTLTQAANNETIWSSVIYNYYGDRTPLVLPVQNVLTPLGGQQLYSVGSFFRDRYVVPNANASNSAINGLSKDELDTTQTSVMSSVDEFVVSSAQAFMQGLYPPRNTSSRTLLNPMSILANGSIVDFPLGGYQYSQIYTASRLDPNSIYVAGDVNCAVHDLAALSYVDSQESAQTRSATKDFYNTLESTVMSGIFPSSMVSYDEAYLIYDYLNYEYTHNQAARKQLSETDLSRAKSLASQWIHATSGMTSATGTGIPIQTISGRTMAAQAIALLVNNIETNGMASRLNMLFGSFEPMVAFAALAQLPQANTDFYSIPDYGSSMVFELYSNGLSNNVKYPNLSDLMVRFLFRNGTDSKSNLDVYNLFGRNDAQGDLSLKELLMAMENLTLPSVGDWCNTCQSGNVSIFCASYVDSTSFDGSGSPSRQRSHQSRISLAIAGVIGAVVTLFLAGLVLALVITVGGVRVYRTKAKRRSEVGGFKAGEKLASDPDLPITNGIGATVVGKGSGRIGSWELREHNHPTGMNPRNSVLPDSAVRSSFEADDLEVSPSSVPTKIEERV